MQIQRNRQIILFSESQDAAKRFKINKVMVMVCTQALGDAIYSSEV